MKYQLDPLSPTGVSPVALASQMSVSSGINLGAHTTDELPEGSTNLYSQWEENVYGAYTFLQPITTTEGIVVGSDLHSSVMTAFAGATAIFNGDPAATNVGTAFFLNVAYNVAGGFPLGGVYVSGRANGTPAAPSQVTSGQFLGGHAFTAYDNAGAWATSGATHLLPSLWAEAATDVAASVLETNIWLGGIATKMISFESDTNNILLNQAQLDSDMTAYWDSGTTMFMEGSSGKTVFGSTTVTSGLVSVNGDLYFHKETARSIKVEDTTTAATAGALLSITGAAGSSTTSGTGGGITVTAGAAQAGNSGGGALTLKGGAGVGVSAGGNVDIQAGAGLTGGAVRIDPGSGVANGTVRVGTVASTRFGINVTPTARLHIGAGTASASFGQMKLDDTVLLTTPEVGVMEFDSNRLYFTHVLTRNILTATQDVPNTTAVGNITTGEDDLMTYTIPANTMPVNGDRITFRASGTIANNVNAKRLRVKYGGTTIMDTGAAGIPVSAAIQWVVEGEIIRTGAATQKCNANLSTNNATLATYVGYSTAAETLTNAITLKLTGEATSTNDIVQETFSYRIN